MMLLEVSLIKLFKDDVLITVKIGNFVKNISIKIIQLRHLYKCHC